MSYQLPDSAPRAEQPQLSSDSAPESETAEDKGEMIAREPIRASQEIYIPVHNLTRLTPPEVKVLNHPAVQRLGDVYQLGQTFLVYRGATHRRLEHALGTLHVAQMIIDSLADNAQGPPSEEGDGQWFRDYALSVEEVAFVRLGALVHDLGHLPAGHTLEDELGLLDRHDGEQRLGLILDRKQWHGVSTESLREVIDRIYSEVGAATGLGITPTEIVCELISQSGASREIATQQNFRVSVCKDLIGNTICADLLDYLHRDWYHIGKPKHFDTRLLEYMEIRRHQNPPAGVGAQNLVIYLRGGAKVRTDAITAILDLLETRYQLGEIALFHRTKLLAAAMLERVVAELNDALSIGGEAWKGDLAEKLLECSDAQMVELFIDSATEAKGAEENKERLASLAAAETLARALRMRKLHKYLYAGFAFDLGHDVRSVQDWYAGSIGAANRLSALRKLEDDFDLSRGSLVMYCPDKEMNTKIAEVKVLISGAVHTLDSYEAEEFQGDQGLTGGHLLAQKRRFSRLWRVQFGIEEKAKASLKDRGMLITLERTVKELVLGCREGSATLYDNAFALAKDLAGTPESPLHEKKLVAVGVGERSRPVLTYPSGAPTLKSYVVE